MKSLVCFCLALVLGPASGYAATPALSAAGSADGTVVSDSAVPARVSATAQDRPSSAQGLTGSAKNAGSVEMAQVDITADRATSTLPLQKATVSGSHIAIPLIDLPASVSVIQAASIDEWGFLTAQDATELGVGIIEYTEKVANPLFETRGFYRDNVLIYRDGIRQDAEVESSRPMDPFNLASVEILKGPDGLLTGLGSVGATIVYNPKMPTAGQADSTGILLSDDSFSLSREGVENYGHFGKGDERWDYRLGLVNERQEQGYADNTHEDNYDVLMSLLNQRSKRLTFTGTVEYLDTDILGQNGIPVVNRNTSGYIAPVSLSNNYDVAGAFSYSQDLHADAAVTDDLGGGLVLKDTAYVFGTDQKEMFTDDYQIGGANPNSAIPDPAIGGLFANPLSTTMTVQLIDYQRADSQIGDRLDFSHGVSLTPSVHLDGTEAVEIREDFTERWDYANTNTFITGVNVFNPGVIVAPTLNPANATYKRLLTNESNLAEEEDLDLFGLIKVLGGLSWDDTDITFYNSPAQPYVHTNLNGTVNGRVGIVVPLADSLNAYGSYVNSSTPNYSVVSLPVANATFQLQYAQQWEAGLKGDLLQNRLDFTAATYRIVYNNLVAYEPNPTNPNGPYIQANIGQQSAYGAELALSARPWRGLEIDGSEATTHSRYDDDDSNLAGTENLTGHSASFVPNVQANLDLRYKFDFGLSAGWMGEYVGDRYADNGNLTVMPAYVMQNADLTLEHGNQTYTFRVINLGNERAIIDARTYGYQANEMKVADPQTLQIVYASKF